MASFASVPTLADYLVNGYWAWSGYQGTQPRHWTSSTVTVNITDLTAAEQALAVSALNAWHEIANISFTFTSGAAQITYNNNGSGIAVTSQTVSGTTLTSATVQISSDWWPNDNIYSYMYQTYLHETGHALGLGHQGPYNGSATYGVDNLYTNDTWQWSIMSYMSQNNYGGATYDYVITPEMADIYAMQSIYGSTSTRIGSTTYGFGSNAGSIYDFNQYSGTPALTIYDSGGTDTLNCSGYSVGQTIDLNPGHWSSIGGEVNNIGIYLTSNIENAVGGTGSDLIIPNGALVGTLTGFGGNDTFQGTLFGLSAYTITDMNVGDRINFTNGSLPTFYHTLVGTSLHYGPGAAYGLTLSNNPIGHLVERVDAVYGGVDLVVAANDPHLHDFNGDDRSDFVWRNVNSGTTSIWEMNGGTLLQNESLGNVSTDWDVVGTADFNRDHQSDILWHNHNTGGTSIWQMNGGQLATSFSLGNINTDWEVANTGDFNGDGRGDILWHNVNNGSTGIWEMNGGALLSNPQLGNISTDWQIAGVGDFNGDNRSDILWHNVNTGGTSIWHMDGGTLLSNPFLGNISTDWQIAGVGDFNGDNRSDILWHNVNTGGTSIWHMNGGTLLSNPSLGNISTDWQIESTADVNDDGRSDIVWHNAATGGTSVWEMNGGTILANLFMGNISPDWHVVA
jgi:hypothetical protein